MNMLYVLFRIFLDIFLERIGGDKKRLESFRDAIIRTGSKLLDNSIQLDN